MIDLNQIKKDVFNNVWPEFAGVGKLFEWIEDAITELEKNGYCGCSPLDEEVCSRCSLLEQVGRLG